MKKENKKKPKNVTTAFSLPSSIMERILLDADKDERTPSFIIRKIILKHYGIK